MDRITSIKIKKTDGTYTDEIPIGVRAENVLIEQGHEISQADVFLPEVLNNKQDKGLGMTGASANQFISIGTVDNNGKPTSYTAATVIEAENVLVEQGDETLQTNDVFLPEVLNNKADKVSNAVNGNFAALDATGNLTDSGHKHSDYLTSHQDITGKADKVSNATNGNFAALDSNGNLTDSGHKHSDYLTSHQDITGKMDKPTSATSGNLAMFNGSRNPVDSGIIASSITPPIWEYDGVDLSTKFASEISSYASVWAWLKARLTSHNLTGIHVKDYITFTCTNDYTFKAQIAGVNPYLGFGDTELTNWHIDFVSKELWADAHVWNKKDYNNGLAGTDNRFPWTCCDLYYWLNSKSGSVPNGTSVNPSTVAVNYSSTGVFDKLPSTLKAVIVEKSINTGGRYDGNGLLTNDNSYGSRAIGKLWIPTEMEVYGCCAWGTNGYSQGDGVQYPLFKDQKMRIKRTSGGARGDWWLLNPSSGYTTDVGRVTATGIANRFSASATWIRVPVCFRVAGTS